MRINVLPERRARRAGKILKTLLISLTVLISVPLVIETVIWYVLDRRVAAFEREKVTLTQALETLKARVKEVENVERDNKAFEEKRKVIEQLKTKQGVPVRLLSEVSQALPPGVWLATLTEQAGKVGLTGKAQTNADLVDFVLRLQRSPFFKEVMLVESREASEEKTAVYAFIVTCALAG